MGKIPKNIYLAAMGCVVSSAVFFTASNYGTSGLTSTIGLALSILIFVIGSLIFFFAPMYEILTAKNDRKWKAIWCIVLLIGGIFGFLIYYVFARKDYLE